jgi:hypothetical protein
MQQVFRGPTRLSDDDAVRDALGVEWDFMVTAAREIDEAIRSQNSWVPPTLDGPVLTSGTAVA